MAVEDEIASRKLGVKVQWLPRMDFTAELKIGDDLPQIGVKDEVYLISDTEKGTEYEIWPTKILRIEWMPKAMLRVEFEAAYQEIKRGIKLV